MSHPVPEAGVDADGYVFPGGEQGGGIQRIDPEPELAETEGWDWQELLNGEGAVSSWMNDLLADYDTGSSLSQAPRRPIRRVSVCPVDNSDSGTII